MARSASKFAIVALSSLFVAACGGSDDPAGEGNAGSAGFAGSAGSAGMAGTAGSGSGGQGAGGSGGAAGGQGAAAGAGGAAGGGAGGSGVACPTDALLCDDFESGSIDSKAWTVSTKNGGKVSVTKTSAFEGSHGLQIDLGTAPGANGFIVVKDLFPLKEDHFFGRAYVKLDPTEIDSHSYLLSATGKTSLGDNASYRLDYNKGRLNSRYTNNATIKEHGGLKKFGYDLLPKTWLCVEWEYDGENDRMKYWMDGKEIAGMVVDGTETPLWDAPNFDSFRIGWHNYQDATNAKAYVIAYDAIVLAKSRVGCLP